MRNATSKDVENLKRYGAGLYTEVMFETIIDGELVKAHPKLHNIDNPYDGAVVLETYDGVVFVAPEHNLRAIESKPGTPKKPKKPHVKGTKPFKKYRPDEVKIGDKLITRGVGVVEVEDISRGVLEVYSAKHQRLALVEQYRSREHGKNEWDIVGVWEGSDVSEDIVKGVVVQLMVEQFGPARVEIPFAPSVIKFYSSFAEEIIKLHKEGKL